MDVCGHVSAPRCASAFGPLLITHLRDARGSYVSGLYVIAGIMAL
jgi:MFS transporter, OFA family, oxalate/formate antiporter